MSFLPYARTAPVTWWLAGSGSAFVHVGLISLAIASTQGLITLAATPPPPDPKYTITVTPLNSDTIAGPVLQQGEVGADGRDGSDPLTAVQAAEKLAALAPETTPVSPSTPEALGTIDAQNLPARKKPQPVDPIPDAPQVISPLVPENLAPNRGEQPVQPSATVQPVAPNIAAAVSTTLTPIRPTIPLAPATPTAQTAQTAAPSTQDLAISDLLRRIRVAQVDPCFLALPRRDGDTGVGLALISRSEAAIERFNQTVLTTQDTALRQTRTFVDERQCAALNFIRRNQDYPATRLGLQLDATRVPSGGRLQGRLRGTAGRYVTLLLIDNNGVVQDLQRFISFSGNITRFDVPVTRAGAPRDTGQILLAIATHSPAPVLRDRAGLLADDVFAGLTDPLASKAALAVATFDVDTP